jgi:hypothetical protein
MVIQHVVDKGFQTPAAVKESHFYSGFYSSHRQILRFENYSKNNMLHMREKI